MMALTQPEIHEFLRSNESGWKGLPNGSLRKHSNEAVCLTFHIPESRNPLRAFTQDCITALDEHFNRNGYLLWLQDWHLGTEELAQIGWASCELMRRGYAEYRSLETAPGHRFRSDEDRACQAFLLQAFIHQWPTLLAPDLGQYLIEIDEEAVYFYLPNSETAQHVSERMQRWKHSRKGN